MKPRVGTILLIIALLVAIVAAANFYVGRNSERAQRVLVEEQLDVVTQAKAALEREKADLTKAKTTLEEQVTQLTKQAKEVAEQFAQEKRARETLTTELAQVRRDATQVKGQLDSERKEKAATADELAKAKQSYQALSNELTTLRQAKEALEKRVKEMLAARAKEAEQIVVTPASAAPKPAAATSPAPASPVPASAKTSEGKVLVVNRDLGFVVLNLGSKDGVRRGTRFALSRNNKPVATVEVDKVYDNMCAANLLEEEKKGEVKEGDIARLLS